MTIKGNLFLLIFSVFSGKIFIIRLLYGIVRLLSIKFLCVTLSHMSIGRRVVRPVTFQQVNHAPYRKASAQSHNEDFKDFDSRVEKFHKLSPFIERPFLGYKKSRPEWRRHFGPRWPEVTRTRRCLNHQNSEGQLPRPCPFLPPRTPCTRPPVLVYCLNFRRRNRRSRWKACFLLSNTQMKIIGNKKLWQ